MSARLLARLSSVRPRFLLVLAGPVLLAALASPAAAGGGVSFATARSFPAGDSPSSVAIGDLNHDRRPDLAVANAGSDDVSVLLGNGDGSFQLAESFSVRRSATSVAIGDLNHDRRPDLAVANGDYIFNSCLGLVSVLLGNGDGSFGAARNFRVRGCPFSVAISDLNGDRRPDLAVATVPFPLPGDVSVLVGKGNGSFRAAQRFAADLTPVSVAIGDLNGDRKPDLAAANRGSNNVSVLLNTTPDQLWRQGPGPYDGGA